MILKIKNKRISNFSNYTINLKYNAIASSFSFDIANDIDFDMLGFNDCEIIDETFGTLITGTILSATYLETEKPTFTKIHGYSRTGLLEDCTIPDTLYPLQFDNLSLLEITALILGRFRINFILNGIDVNDSARVKYEKSTAKPEETIKEYLTRLASEKGILLTHDRYGNLVFERLKDAIRKIPVASFAPGVNGVKRMQLNIDAQKFHSTITMMKQASSDNPDSGESTIINPYVSSGVNRPIVKIIESNDALNMDEAARFELSNEISNIKLTFDTTKFVRPGSLVNIKNQKLRLSKDTQFFVEEITISGNEKDIDMYTITAVPRDVYTTGTPVSIFD